MSKEKIKRLLKDAENRREEEKQERMQTKVVISTPYPKDSSEFANFMGSIGEMNRDNFFEYIIKVCDTCEECGAIDDTVELAEIPDNTIHSEFGEEGQYKHGVLTGKTKSLMLCNYCRRGYES